MLLLISLLLLLLKSKYIDSWYIIYNDFLYLPPVTDASLNRNWLALLSAQLKDME